jgi:hypothetical protein
MLALNLRHTKISFNLFVMNDAREVLNLIKILFTLYLLPNRIKRKFSNVRLAVKLFS